MRRTRLGLSFVLALVACWLAPSALAQETKSARGTVSAMGSDFITVKTGANELKFVVDPKTVLTASGAGTAERRADAAGKPGPRLSEFLKTGDAVEVRYREMAGTLRASEIRQVRDAGSGGGTMSDERSETASGTVESITGSVLTITGSVSGGGSFKQAFGIDAKTNVVAQGAGTAAAAKGGKVTITDFVGVGDEVTVTYHRMGDALHADEVRVRSRKK